MLRACAINILVQPHQFMTLYLYVLNVGCATEGKGNPCLAYRFPIVNMAEGWSGNDSW